MALRKDTWPDEPADENISTDPPNEFDRGQEAVDPGAAGPRPDEEKGPPERDRAKDEPGT